MDLTRFISVLFVVIIIKMNVGYVWSRLYPFSRESFKKGPSKDRLESVCNWIVRASDEKILCRSGISNLIRRIGSDYNENSTYWLFISESRGYGDFVNNLQEYSKIREKFPSRDKIGVEAICFPWSNERLYGKGINSRVRQEDS